MSVIEDTFGAAVKTLGDSGLSSRWYMIPDHAGYEPVIGEICNVYCLETFIGKSHVDGYETFAVAQSFSATYPSMIVTLVIERHAESGAVGSHAPTFNVENDTNFSRIFLPTMYTAFNELNPTAEKRGIIVQIYKTKMSWRDLIHSSVYTLGLLRHFRRDGQLAIIAVDFDDPLITLIARIGDPIARLLFGDFHQIASTNEPSKLSIPVDDRRNGTHLLNNYTTACDKGFILARQYLDEQYMYASSKKIDHDNKIS